MIRRLWGLRREHAAAHDRRRRGFEGTEHPNKYVPE